MLICVLRVCNSQSMVRAWLATGRLTCLARRIPPHTHRRLEKLAFVLIAVKVTFLAFPAHHGHVPLRGGLCLGANLEALSSYPRASGQSFVR